MKRRLRLQVISLIVVACCIVSCIPLESNGWRAEDSVTPLLKCFQMQR